MGFLDKMRQRIAGPANGDAAAAAPPTATESDRQPAVRVEFSDPGPHAVTCPIRFDRPVSPGGTSLFETPEEATAWPAAAALLGIPGVHSVIGKGDVLVVARRDSVTWDDVLPGVAPALARVFEGVEAPDVVPAGAAPSAGDAEVDPGDLRGRVQAVIDRDINPAVADHGGVITLLDVQDTRVFVHMGGGCQGCAMSTATLKHGVESMLRAKVPEVSEVFDTTDHAAGANPYYQP